MKHPPIHKLTGRQIRRKRKNEFKHANQAARAAERDAAAKAENASAVEAETAEKNEVDEFFGTPVPRAKPRELDERFKNRTLCRYPVSGGECARDPGHDGRHSKTRFKKDGP